MKPADIQMTLEDINDEYKAFVDKFKPKKTTDDCFTPDNIYEVVKDWACKEYGIDPEKIVRPFWPGGDYKLYPYKEGDVVLDNPPFSIVGQIVKYYNLREIPFFIFAPYLTNFSSGIGVSHIISEESITYQNGANVDTSFLTNMDKYLIRSVPELCNAIKEANKENIRKDKKELPKYVYPDEVLTAAAVGYMSKYGIDFRVKKSDCYFVRFLDIQKAEGKAIFGSGFLLSEKAAAEKAAAEKAAAEKAAAEKAAAEKAAAVRWKLSDREWEIVKSLGREGKEEKDD